MPPDTFAGDLCGGLPAQFRVWSDCVVVVLPGGQHEPRVGQRGEQRLVEAFVAQAAVEALDEAVPRRLARCDVMPLDLALLRPAQERRRGQFDTIVADHRVWLATHPDQAGQVPGHPCTGERRISHQRQALPREVVDHARYAEAPTPDQAVGDEVERPPLFRTIR